MVGQSGDVAARSTEEVVHVQPENDPSGFGEQTAGHRVVRVVVPAPGVVYGLVGKLSQAVGEPVLTLTNRRG